MRVSIDETGFIQTVLYTKDTAVVQYLLPSSCHPGHVCRNIVYSLAYRLLRLVSVPREFKKELDKLRLDLLSRDYDPKVISNAFARIHTVKREDALKRVDKQGGPKCVPLVITYHPTLPSISKLARCHWKVIVKTVPNWRRSVLCH